MLKTLKLYNNNLIYSYFIYTYQGSKFDIVVIIVGQVVALWKLQLFLRYLCP
jgi:hypothetical protein